MNPLLVAVLALQLQLPSQTPTPSEKGSIEGVVLEVSGKPIAGAQVRAFWSPPPITYSSEDVPKASTDNNGRFRIENVGAGGYQISVTASGFVYQAYGAVPGIGNTGTVTALEPRQALQGITLRMTPGSAIAGRITSTNGQPLVRMQAIAVRKAFDDIGSLYLLAQGNAETNDRGEYRIAGLVPGRYYIRATSISASLIESEARSASYAGRPAPVLPTPGLFAPAYFPGQADPSKASIVEVQGSAEVRNIDLALSKQPTFSIWGRVTDPYTSGPPQEKFTIMMFPVQQSYPTSVNSTSPISSPTGYFELPSVSPGTYMVTAQLPIPPESPEQLLARTTPGASVDQLRPPPVRGVALVRVLDADVENVAITLARELTVSGRVSLEGGTAARAEMKVEFRPVDSNGRIGRAVAFATTSADGEFTRSNIMPFLYRVTLTNLPEGYYVKDARLGNVDLLTQPLPLTSSPDDSMRIILAKGGAVQGTVIDALQRPVPNQEVVLIPDNPRNRGDLYKTAITDANGRFSIQGIAPGEYKAYAWQTIEQFAYFDVDLVQQFEDKAIPIHATESSDATVNLTLIL